MSQANEDGFSSLAEDFEQLKTNLVQAADRLSELALAGHIHRLLVVRMNPEGTIQFESIGCHPSDSLGMLISVQGILMNQVVRR